MRPNRTGIGRPIPTKRAPGRGIGGTLLMPAVSAGGTSERGESGVDDSQDPSGWDNLDEDAKRQAQDKAEKVRKMYEPGVRPTETVPGTDGMVSGTAFAEPDDEHRGDESEADRQ